jgi:hypothetical protein
LAFISEFNVQILYLPGLKNVVADFLCAPTKQPLDQSPPRRWQIQWIFEEMAAEQNRCPETQRLLGGTNLKLAFRQTGAQRLAGDVSTGNFCPIVPLKFRKNIFLINFTMLLTLGGSPPVILFHLGLCGAVFPATSSPGPAGVWPASGARSTATHAWSPSPSPSRNGVFLIYMLISWAHCSTVIILILFSPSLIARPNGWKPSPFQKLLRRHAQKL